MQQPMSSGGRPARSREFLEDWCRRLDGGPYPAYRDLLGSYLLNSLCIELHRVQPDPFAGPSRLRLLIPYASTAFDASWGALEGGEGARVPGLVDRNSARAVGARDFLGRWIGRWLETGARRSGPRPEAAIDAHGQQVLDRSTVLLRPDHLEIRLQVDLPARGRRILGREAAGLLLHLPERLAVEALGSGSLDQAALRRHADTVEDFAFLQEELEARGWIAFIADGSRLARRAGNDDRPLSEEPVVPFESPPGFTTAVSLPHGGRIEGMAVTPGVTLLCGGGFHGKSTLLRALAAAVHPHVPGDGRERMAVRRDAQSVRAEDGRAVTGADLRPFIRDLPFHRSTAAFTTDNASGSTSQAAAILEAIQASSRLLLIDEDTSATNFMIRDAFMERLIRTDQEPIIPFLDRARALFEGLGVSSVLVIGGSGEYFRVADRVLFLDTYRPQDRTEEARRIAVERPAAPVASEAVEELLLATRRDRLLPGGPPGDPRIKALDARRLLVGGVPLDLSGMESLRDASQGRFLGRVLGWALREYPGRSRSTGETQRDSAPAAGAFDAGSRMSSLSIAGLEAAYAHEWNARRLDGFDRDLRGDLAAVRLMDLAAAVQRLRVQPAPGAGWGLEGHPERAIDRE